MEEKNIKRTDNHGNEKSEKKSQNKGFYVAVAMSLAMVAVACFFATRGKEPSPITEMTTQPTTAITTTQMAVAKPETSVPKTTTVVKETTKATTTTKQTTVATIATTQPVTEPLTEPVAMAKIVFYPVSGEILNPFSNGELVKSKTTGAWQTHNGTDFLAKQGDSVFAIKDGTVLSVDKDALWGIMIVIDHGDGITAKYCGLNENVIAKVGEAVKGGFEIGTIGENPDIESVEESHIHLELTDGSKFIDPIAFLQS